MTTKQPYIVVAVLEALSQRRGLGIAIGNRDEYELEQILAFTARYIANPRYTPLLIVVATCLCENYGTQLGQSQLMDELFEKLHRSVKAECAAQRNMLELVGILDATMMSSNT